MTVKWPRAEDPVRWETAGLCQAHLFHPAPLRKMINRTVFCSSKFGSCPADETTTRLPPRSNVFSARACARFLFVPAAIPARRIVLIWCAAGLSDLKKSETLSYSFSKTACAASLTLSGDLRGVCTHKRRTYQMFKCLKNEAEG